MKICKVFAALLFLVATGVHAIQPIPDQGGFSGFVSLGAGVASVESNLLAEAAGQDLSDENIDDLGSPDSESFGLPVAAFELSYVFDSKNTQLFLGNLLEDYLRFDLSTRIGVRQNLGDAGLVSFAVLNSPIKTKVWENPYATGVDRDSTDRGTSGFRIAWDRIFGSGLEVRLSDREAEIDDENSGVGLGLTPAQIASLDRNGDITTINIRYLFGGSKTSQFVVGLNSREADLDGDAMSFDSASIELNWIYTPDKDLKVVTTLAVGSREFDEDNPVFGEKTDIDFNAVGVTAFFPGLWGFKEWVPNAAVVVSNESSDVDFFDSSVSIVSFGFLNRF